LLGDKSAWITFQMAEVTVPQQMFAEILSLIARLQAPPAPARQRRVSDETDDEGRGAPGMKQSHGCRTREASNPNDWLRTRLIAPEFHCGVPR